MPSSPTGDLAASAEALSHGYARAKSPPWIAIVPPFQFETRDLYVVVGARLDLDAGSTLHPSRRSFLAVDWNSSTEGTDDHVR